MNSTSKFRSLNLRHFSTLPQRKSWTFHHPSCSAGGTPITGWNIYVSDDGLTYPSTPTAFYPEIHIFVFSLRIVLVMIQLQSDFFLKKSTTISWLKATESAAFVSYTLDCTNFGGVNRGQQQLGPRNGVYQKCYHFDTDSVKWSRFLVYMYYMYTI